MKEVKFFMLTALCVALFSFSSCSDDDDFQPAEDIQAALVEKYPTATRVDWEKKKTFFVADCRIDGKDADVWFSAEANWLMTEFELLQTDLPTAISAALTETEYAAWRVDDVDLLEYPNKASEYVIEVEQDAQEMDLYFSPDGELLRTKDVSNADDTHWPE